MSNFVRPSTLLVIFGLIAISVAVDVGEAAGNLGENGVVGSTIGKNDVVKSTTGGKVGGTTGQVRKEVVGSKKGKGVVGGVLKQKKKHGGSSSSSSSSSSSCSSSSSSESHEHDNDSH